MNNSILPDRDQKVGKVGEGFKTDRKALKNINRGNSR